MSDLPPRIVSDNNWRDIEHLKLLSIFHFVCAGLALLGILFLLGHFVFMSSFVFNPKMWQNQRQGPPPAEIFAILKWFYLAGGLWFLTSGILNVLSGLFIRARKHRTFSIVVAALNCLHIPLGTILGVFTLIVLVRQSVRELYEARYS